MHSIIRTTLIGGLLASTTAIAMPPGGPDPDRAEHMKQRFAERFDITDSQQAEIAQIREHYAPRLETQRDELRDLLKAERDLDPTAESYVADVQSAAEQRAQLSVAHAALRAEQRQLIAGVLTDEQRTAIAEARDEHKARRGDRHFKRFGRGKGGCEPAPEAG